MARELRCARCKQVCCRTTGVQQRCYAAGNVSNTHSHPVGDYDNPRWPRVFKLLGPAPIIRVGGSSTEALKEVSRRPRIKRLGPAPIIRVGGSSTEALKEV